MPKKFTVEALVGEVSEIRELQGKPIGEWLVGGDRRGFIEHIDSKVVVFTVYNDVPEEVRKTLTASLRYALSSQMSSGQRLGERYELSMIVAD